MKIVFLYSGSESVGVSALSAYLKAHGHDTALVFDPAHFRGSRGRDNRTLARLFDPSRETLVEAALRESPDVLACSCFTGNYRWALDLASEIKRRSNKPVTAIFGGVHASMVPERVIRESAVDALVVGEGEEAMLELVASIEDGQITNTAVANSWVKSGCEVYKNPVRPYIRELDSLPLPDKELFYGKVPFLRRGYLLMTARGCPYNCSYCSNSAYHDIYCGEKTHIRRFSPGRVIEELRFFSKGGKIEWLNIYDDIFTLDKKWLEEFTPMYRREFGLPFLCNIHPDHCSEEIVRLIKEAGCHTVRLGVQTVHDPTLRKSLHRGGSREKVGQAIETLKKFGIRVKVEHILGLPGEDEDIVRDAVAFYNEFRPTKVQAFWLIPFPGTRIHNTAVETGMISSRDAEDFKDGSDRLTYTLFKPNPTTGRSLESLKPFQLLLGALPFLPKKTVERILDKNLYRRIPYSWVAYQALVMANALIQYDREDIYSLLYVMAKKNTP